MPKKSTPAQDSRTKLLQAFWKKVAETGKQIDFPHKIESDAKYFRLALYRAIAAYRNDPLLDGGLYNAAQECVVSISQDKLTVSLKKRAPDEMLLGIAAQLGIEVDGLKPAARDNLDLEAEAMAKRLLQSTEKLTPGEPAKANPYYNREDL